MSGTEIAGKMFGLMGDGNVECRHAFITRFVHAYLAAAGDACWCDAKRCIHMAPGSLGLPCTHTNLPEMAAFGQRSDDLHGTVKTLRGKV